MGSFPTLSSLACSGEVQCKDFGRKMYSTLVELDNRQHSYARGLLLASWPASWLTWLLVAETEKTEGE